MTSSLKVPVVVRDDYTIYLERFADRTWGHVDFYRTSATSIRNFSKDVQLLVSLQGEPLLVSHRPDDRKHARFLRLTGATFLTTITDHQGNPLEVHHYA